MPKFLRSERARKPHNNENLSRWKRVRPFVIGPGSAVVIALLGWWWIPNPRLPSALEAVDTMPKPHVSNATPPAPSTKDIKISTTLPAPTHSQATTQAKTGGSHTGKEVSQKTLVAFGDSITFGFNLPDSSPGHPSPDAYPYLVGQSEGWQVKDLGVPGSTSTDLLQALSTPAYKQALHSANLVTVDIGSNDLLHPTYDLISDISKPPSNSDLLSQAQYQQALTTFQANLHEVLSTIRRQTKAPIVLLNLYDPFPDASSVHNLAEPLLAAANQIIEETAAEQALPVVNVYQVMNHEQLSLIRINELDIHPTVGGQSAIAHAVEDVLKQPLWNEPVAYAVAANTKQGCLVYSKPELGPNAIWWLSPDEGCTVVGVPNGDWLQVLTPAGTDGYVRLSDVHWFLRANPNMKFQSLTATLPSGTFVDETSERSAQMFVKNGVLYAPVSFLGGSAGSQVSYDGNTRTVEISTPNRSGLIQTGPLTPSPANAASAPSPHLVPTYGADRSWDLHEIGIEVRVDGEPLTFSAPVYAVGNPTSANNIYIPASAFWTALGGQVTLDAHGLPQLSTSGS